MKKLLILLVGLAATINSQAKIITQEVSYEHDGVKLIGSLKYDDEKTALGKVPGVLVVHEWWGRTNYVKVRANQLAELGYVAFALDMYGEAVTTTDAKVAGEYAGKFYGSPLMAARAQAGLDQLLATGLVDEKKVAAIGYCFGGSTVMALAYTGAPLAGIVSFHGGPIAASAEAAELVGKNHTKFLICHGAVDPMVSKPSLDGFLRSLDEGHIDYQFIAYAGAKHAFSNPLADKYAIQNHLDGIGYNYAADQRSWEHMRLFLEELFQ
jgi:dienelactone hydrolase